LFYRQLTLQEQAEYEAGKRQRNDDRVIRGINDGWRLIDSSRECFKLKELAPENAFISFNFRGPTSLLKIFKSFVSDDLLEKVLNKISPNNIGISYGSRKSRGKESNATTHRHMHPNIKRLKQKLAYEIRIIGLQKTPLENETKKNSLRDAIIECIEHFAHLNPFTNETLSRDHWYVLNTNMI
jgi:hypothetical protein